MSAGGHRLHRYVARQYALSLLVCLTALVGLLVGTTLVEHAGALVASPEASARLAQQCWAATVQVAYQNFPVAAALSTLMCGAALSRRGELLAIAASGKGPWHVFLPWGAVVGGAALLCFAAGEGLLPRAVQQGRDVGMGQHARLGAAHGQRAPWYKDGDHLLYLPEVDRETARFCRPTVYRLSEGRLVALLQAKSLVYRDGWFLLDVERRFVERPEVEMLPRHPLPLQVRPQDLLDSTGDPQLLAYGELRRLIARRERAGFDATPHRLEAALRLAQPLSACLLALLCWPVALRLRQRDSLARTLGGGVVGVVAYLIAAHLCRLLAIGRHLSPFCGAMGAPLGAAALAAGVWLWGFRAPPAAR